MRKVEIKSVEDMKALPFDEWVEVPDGFDIDFIDVEDDGRVRDNKILVTLPESVTKKLRLSKKNKFTAVYSDRKLIIEKV